MNHEKQSFTINSRKLDGTIHRHWKAVLLEETEDLLIFEGVFEREIAHSQLGVIRRGTVSREFYWRNRWYNIFQFREPEGDLRNFYCNINQPPAVENNVLNYIDLDIDVVVWKDFSFEILDLDEFESNAEKFGYSPELREKASDSLEEVLELIKNKSFPFNLKI